MNDDRCARILSHYGREHQERKLIEECGELLAELGRFLNGELLNVSDLVHECADVIVVVSQLENVFDPTTNRFEHDAKKKAMALIGDVTLYLLQYKQVELVRQLTAQTLIDSVFDLVESLNESPMLLSAIDRKLARQIARIEAEERK